MAAGVKCPYCSGSARKIDARVAGQPTHLTFGYGIRTWRCASCGEVYSVCYPVPPKGSRKGMPDPHDGILRTTVRDSVQGFAHPVVLTANAPACETVLTDTQSPADPSDNIVATHGNASPGVE